MFKTRYLRKALKHAKERLWGKKDYRQTSHKRVFESDTPGESLTMDGLILFPSAMDHLSRMFNVPGAWIKTKQVLQDPEHLQESFNRHVQMLENKKIIVRTAKASEGEMTGCYAVWGEKTVNIDILPMLRLVKEHIDPHVQKWAFIHINGFTLRMFGLLKIKGRDEKKAFPGIYLSTSEDGTFGIKAGLGMGALNHSQMILLDYPQMECASFKRMESEEGQLRERFVKTALSLVGKKIPAVKAFDEHYAQLATVGAPVSEVPIHTLEVGRKILGYSKKYDNLLVGAWNTQAPPLLAYLGALAKVSHEQALSGLPLDAHNLNKAAGLLLKGGSSEINQSLVLTKN